VLGWNDSSEAPHLLFVRHCWEVGTVSVEGMAAWEFLRYECALLIAHQQNARAWIRKRLLHCVLIPNSTLISISSWLTLRNSKTWHTTTTIEKMFTAYIQDSGLEKGCGWKFIRRPLMSRSRPSFAVHRVLSEWVLRYDNAGCSRPRAGEPIHQNQRLMSVERDERMVVVHRQGNNHQENPETWRRRPCMEVRSASPC
jgi:hypothetical protein